MSTAANEKVLRDICKELHETNRRLDRLVQSSIFSVSESPTIKIYILPEEYERLQRDGIGEAVLLNDE